MDDRASLLILYKQAQSSKLVQISYFDNRFTLRADQTIY